MERVDEMNWEKAAAALRDRLTRLSEASLRINESLEMETVLQGALDSARSLTGARYGVLSTVDAAGDLEELLASNLTPEEFRGLQEIPGGLEFFEYLSGLPGPLRVADLSDYARALGLSGFDLAVPARAFLTVPIRRRGDSLGIIYVAKSETGETFSQEDEETLSLFASQAALVIANARRHREERRARASLETLINTSPVGVVVLDARTGAALSFNREARRIAEALREPEQEPEALLEVLTVRRGDGREFSLAEISVAQALQASETVRVEEILLTVPGGRSITVLMNATPIDDEEGEVDAFVVTMQDMTPLQDLELMRAEFLGMVSHELRTPLTAIRGSATTVLDAEHEMDPVELRQFLRIIVEQADSMRELIGGLLDVARIESGTLPVNPEPVDVFALLDRARSTFLSGGGRSSLEIELGPDLPLVMADRRRIVQVIGNLLSNAARHSPESSLIRLSAARQGAEVAVAVADEGQGIAAEQLPRLFGKFSRRQDGEQGGSPGLGLVICKGIVEAHGGRIWAESAGLELGACFTFTLPAAAESLGRRPSAPTRRRVAAAERILAVDDDPQTLRLVRRALTEAGYEPIVTADPAEARRLMEEHRPSLVLLDMVMPGSDGIELMEQLFGIASVPVIFLSAYGQDRVIARAFETGAADYIVKPFSTTELVARVQAALRRQVEPYGAGMRQPYVQGDLVIDYTARTVTVSGLPLQLTGIEYNLLQTLSVNAGRVLSHEQLVRRVWKGYVGTGAVRTVVKRLRRKLGEEADSPNYIFSERGVGYRMAKGETRETDAAST